jgi:hypothetical protein
MINKKPATLGAQPNQIIELPPHEIPMNPLAGIARQRTRLEIDAIGIAVGLVPHLHIVVKVIYVGDISSATDVGGSFGSEDA